MINLNSLGILKVSDNMERKKLYKAVVEIKSPKSPLDRHHVTIRPSRAHYINLATIYLRVDEGCTEKEVHDRFNKNKQRLMREYEKRFRRRFGPLRVTAIRFQGEKERNPNLIFDLYVFDI